MDESEEPKNGEQQQPEENSRDAEWLDELATQISGEWGEDARQGGEPDNSLEPNAEDEIPAWLKADLEKEVASDEQVPDWLVPELANAGAIATSLDRASTSQDPGEDELSEDEDRTLLFRPGKSSANAEPSSGLDEEELDWLNEMADSSETDVEDYSGSESEQESAISSLIDSDTNLVSEADVGEEEFAEGIPPGEDETTSVDEDQAEEREPLPPGTGQLTWMEDIEAVEEQMWVGEEEVEILPEMVVDNAVSAPTVPLSMEEVGDEEEATVYAEVPEDPDEAMAWLENLAAKQRVPEEELASQQEEPSQIEVDATVFDIEEIESLRNVESEEPDLIEIAGELRDMTSEVELASPEPVGLEDTLVFNRPAVSIDEVISKEGVKETGEEGAEQEIPEDPDEAMAWLEKLAAEQGASEADLESIEAEFMETGFDEAIGMDGVIEFEQSESSDDAFGFASDLDEALDWLEEMVEFEPGEPSEVVEVVEEPPTPHVVHDVSAAFTEALFEEEESAVELAELDERLAEGEEFATTISPGDSFVGVEITEEELEEAHVVLDDNVIEGDDGVFTQDIELRDGEAEVVEEEDETAEAFAWLDHLAEAESDLPVEMAIEELEEEDTQPAAEASQPRDVETVEPLVESFTETTVEEPAEEFEQDLGWLDTLDGEREQELADVVLEEEAADLEELPVSGELAVEVEEAIEEFESEVEEEELLEEEEAEAVVEEILRDLGQEELGIARSALEAGEMEVAVSRYESLLDDPTVVPFVISDLEAFVNQEGSQVILQRTLGDAYVRNGQLKRALATYRKALDSL